MGAPVLHGGTSGVLLTQLPVSLLVQFYLACWNSIGRVITVTVLHVWALND